MKFFIPSGVPAKKNQWQRSKHGGMFIKQKTSTEIEAITWEIKQQAKGGSFGYQPVSVNVRFYKNYTEIEVLPCPDSQYRSQRRDLDGMLTTCCDILQAAGIVQNDRSIVRIEGSTFGAEKPL